MTSLGALYLLFIVQFDALSEKEILKKFTIRNTWLYALAKTYPPPLRVGRKTLTGFELDRVKDLLEDEGGGGLDVGGVENLA